MKGKYMDSWAVFIFCFICFCNINTSSDICDMDHNCKNCDYCGKTTRIYNSCYYYNMFCFETSNMYILYKNYKYSQFLKLNILIFLKRIMKLNLFVEQQNFH